MIICEHPSGLPVGSLSPSVQFKIATVVSRPKNIFNVQMFHGYEKKLNMISNVQYVSKPIFSFFSLLFFFVHNRNIIAITQNTEKIFRIPSIFSTTIYKITTYLQVGPPGR